MALGVIIGAAIASKAIHYAVKEIVPTVVESYQGSKQESKVETYNSEEGLGVDLRKIKADFQKMMNTNNEPNKAQETFQNEKQDMSQNNTQRIICCDYCDSVIPMDKLYSVCPYCGGTFSKSFEKDYRQNAQNSSQTEFVRSGFYAKCDGCSSTIRYVESDIIKTLIANQAVKARGYRGYTREVKCPKCGTYLPHYESNWK